MASTNVGSDQPTIDITRTIWSMSLSRFSAASVPNQMPIPKMGTMANRASSKVTGKRFISVVSTGSLLVRE